MNCIQLLDLYVALYDKFLYLLCSEMYHYIESIGGDKTINLYYNFIII